MKKFIIWLLGAALLISLISCESRSPIAEHVRITDEGPASTYSNWDYPDSSYVITEQFGFRAEYWFNDTLYLTPINLHGLAQSVSEVDSLLKLSFNEWFPVAKTWNHTKLLE